MKKGRKSPFTREQVILVAASLLILAALTVTGVYLKRQNETMYDGYRLDLAELENGTNPAGDSEGTLAQLPKSTNAASVNSNSVNSNSSHSNNVKTPNAPIKKDDTQAAITPVKPVEEPKKAETAKAAVKSAPKSEKPKETVALPEDLEAGTDTAALPGAEESAEAISQNLESNIAAYQFGDADKLQWPVVGNILINYSMDKSVYFTTLDQYKYNPAVIISADFGTAVAAAADGRVVSVFYDAQIGSAMTVDIGGGYQITYAQLDKLQVKEGDAVAAGQVLAYIGNPTKYYSSEGSNLYFKLTKDDVPVNPMTKLV